MRRTTYMKLTLLAISAALGLVLAEVAVRLVAPEWSDQWKMYRTDPVHGRGLRANVRDAVVHGHSHEFAFHFSTNAQGLRMRADLSPTPQPGHRRVVCVGDSFTFGYGVEHDETYAQRLHTRLEAAGQAVEVINAGFAGGFTMDTEYMFAREVAAGWHPDVIVVGVCLSNDLNDLAQTRWFVTEGRLTAVRKRTDWVPGFIKRSGAVNLLLGGAVPRLRALRQARAGSAPARQLQPTCDLPVPDPGTRPARAGELPAVPPLPREAADWSPPQRAEWLATAWAADAAAHNYTLVFLLIPDADEVQWPSDPERLAYRAQVRGTFVHAAERAGIRVTDPVAAMRARWCDSGEPLYFDVDGHWRPAGHDFVAAWLARELFGVPNPGS